MLSSEQPCPDCVGARLRPESLAVTVGDLSIKQVCQLNINEAFEWALALSGDQRPTPALSAVEGTYKRACLVCHDADIIEQQKLSKTGWTRSVEKMMRWGASVTDADKEPLVDYLFSRFPPR